MKPNFALPASLNGLIQCISWQPKYGTLRIVHNGQRRTCTSTFPRVNAQNTSETKSRSRSNALLLFRNNIYASLLRKRNSKCLRSARTTSLTQYASATHWLVLRIGMANARRRQQFVYWGTHAELLARDTTVEVPIVREETTTVVPAPGPTGKPIQLVATSVTKFVAANLIGGDDLRSVISHNSRVSTVLSPQGEKLAWPQAPHRLSGSKFFFLSLLQGAVSSSLPLSRQMAVRG